MILIYVGLGWQFLFNSMSVWSMDWSENGEYKYSFINDIVDICFTGNWANNI